MLPPCLVDWTARQQRLTAAPPCMCRCNMQHPFCACACWVECQANAAICGTQQQPSDISDDAVSAPAAAWLHSCCHCAVHPRGPSLQTSIPVCRIAFTGMCSSQRGRVSKASSTCAPGADSCLLIVGSRGHTCWVVVGDAGSSAPVSSAVAYCKSTAIFLSFQQCCSNLQLIS